jgi:hypothetical protein
MILCRAWITRVNVAPQPHSFFNFAVSLVFPDQQIGDSARIFEIASHNHAGMTGMLSQLSLAQELMKWPCRPWACFRCSTV